MTARASFSTGVPFNNATWIDQDGDSDVTIRIVYNRSRLESPRREVYKGVVKISVMYPNDDGATFDMDYYCNSHIPLVRELVGATLKGIAVDEGIGQPGSPAPFLAIGHLTFESVMELQSALETHGPKLMADIPNYTNTRPTIQISEVKM